MSASTAADRAAERDIVRKLARGSLFSRMLGSRRQPLAETGTTSVWPMRHSVGALGSRPSMRHTIEARPATGS